MRSKIPIELALLSGALVEIVLVSPLLIVYRHLGLGPFPVWVEILKIFQMPGAPLSLLIMRWDVIQNLAAHFRIAHELYFAAEVLAMLIQTALFALLALAVLSCLPPGRKSKAPSGPVNVN